MIELHGELPETARATTPNGGLLSISSMLKAFAIEVKWERELICVGGGYILGPGSPWQTVALTKGSAARKRRTARYCRRARLAARVTIAKAKPEGAPKEYNPSGVGNTAYVQAAIESELSELGARP